MFVAGAKLLRRQPYFYELWETALTEFFSAYQAIMYSDLFWHLTNPVHQPSIDVQTRLAYKNCLRRRQGNLRKHLSLFKQTSTVIDRPVTVSKTHLPINSLVVTVGMSGIRPW